MTGEIEFKDSVLGNKIAVSYIHGLLTVDVDGESVLQISGGDITKLRDFLNQFLEDVKD